MAKANQNTSKTYANLVKKKGPKPPVLRNVVWAFLVGGAISAVGQVVLGLLVRGGLPLRDATVPTSAVMIGAGAILTGLGVYDEIGKRAGMGSALPITGFANSIVSPAMEYRREGLVLGVGARLFTIAGPVIVYAVAAALVVAVTRMLALGGAGR